MRQVKIFKCLEYEYSDLEQRINDWIREKNINVIDVRLQLEAQSRSPGKDSALGVAPEQSDLMVLVVYEVGK